MDEERLGRLADVTVVAEVGLDRLHQAAAVLLVILGQRAHDVGGEVPHVGQALQPVEQPVDAQAAELDELVGQLQALALRKQINETLPDDQKVSVNDLIVKAAALALRDFPNLNAAYSGDKIIRHKRISVGSAVAIEGGLLTVVQKLSLIHI